MDQNPGWHTARERGGSIWRLLYTESQGSLSGMMRGSHILLVGRFLCVLSSSLSLRAEGRGSAVHEHESNRLGP
jgi:hypothetical protein